MEYLEVHIKIPKELENSIKNERYEKIMTLPVNDLEKPFLMIQYL